MGNSHEQLRTEITSICHKLYDRGYLVATSGNVSVRADDTIIITPTATRKDTMTDEKLVRCDMDGKQLEEGLKPSSEIEMHKAVYAARPDVGAIIHAHPRFCVACTLNQISLTEMILPELVVYTGPVPTSPYATPGTDAQAEAIKPFIPNHNAILMERHGVLVLGRNLSHAFNRLEHLEYAARIIFLARSKGRIEPLPYAEVENLLNRTQAIKTFP